MKNAIIAMAGVSSRFNEGEEQPVLKGIYTTSDETKTLLYSILQKCGGFDRVVLVGGYRYPELESYVREYCREFPFELRLVENPYYQKWGTGYTLKVGLEECLREQECSEITLIEGDLFFDAGSFAAVQESPVSVATYNDKPIISRKAVIAYTDQKGRLHYVFSTSHGAVQIPEPFLAVYNSGQIWRFTDVGRVRELVRELPQEAWEGTNLEFVEAYFSGLDEDSYELLPLATWENCNIREEYRECVGRM